MALTPPELLPEPLSPEAQPIINSPFYPPQYHWPLNSDTKAFAPAANGRRSAQNMPPVAGSRGTRQARPQPGNIGVAWEELELVNQIRQEVADWQDVKGGGKTYHWAEQNCTTGVMPDGHGLAGWAGGLAWSGAGAGLGRALIGGWPIRRWR